MGAIYQNGVCYTISEEENPNTIEEAEYTESELENS